MLEEVLLPIIDLPGRKFPRKLACGAVTLIDPSKRGSASRFRRSAKEDRHARYASRRAELHRMETDEHICPYGLKTRDLLRREGFEVEDHRSYRFANYLRVGLPLTLVVFALAFSLMPFV